MPLQCQLNPKHIVPVSFNNKESFCQSPEENCFQIILVESGCATLRINHDRCFLQSGVLIFRNPGIVIDRLYSHKLEAQSISFQPDFIEMIRTREDYDGKDAQGSEYNYPPFHLFHDLSFSHAGVLPLDPLVRPKAKELVSSAISEMTNQPDNHWCNRVRVNLIELFRLAEEEYTRYIGNENSKTTLARSTLDFIHANYDREITVQMLCEIFHTNHTTLLRDFRVLTGTTIGQYILEYRLHLVREALMFTELTIDEIALKFGFRQASYLSRVFRARTGMAPGQFRNSMARRQPAEYDASIGTALNHPPCFKESASGE